MPRQTPDAIAALLLRVADRLAPRIARAYLDAIAEIRDAVILARLVEMLERGDIGAVLTYLFASQVGITALAAVPLAVRATLLAALPPIGGGTVPPFRPGAGGGPVVRVQLDTLHPTVLQAAQQWDADRLTALTADLRQSVRQAAEAGLRAGENPRATARAIRDAIGLAPSHEEAVRRYRRQLETLDPDAIARDARLLRDRRFDPTVRRAIRDGKPLTRAQIDRMVEAYRRRYVAWHAETIARTAALDMSRAAQRIAWAQAIEQGLVAEADLVKRWVTRRDGRERPGHRAMDGVEVGFRQPWLVPVDGVVYTPGEHTYNCRCVAWIRPRRGAASPTLRAA